MKTTLLLLLLATLCSTSIGRSIHERKRRVAGNEYDAYLDKDPSNDGDYFDEYEEYDEEYEYEPYDYAADLFNCFEGEVQVAHNYMCDGHNDCPDGSDEIPSNCEELGISTTTTSTTTTTTTTTTPTTTTTTTTTTTPTTLPPVEPDIRNLEDYGDYDDACTAEEFQCKSDLSICLPQSQVCDGIHDCPDKEDEANCTEVHFRAYPVIPQNRPVFEGGLDLDTFDIDHMPPKDAKAALNEMEYFYYLENRNGQAISIPDVPSGNNGDKPESSIIRPPVVIMKPPVMEEETPVFIPAEKDNFNDLALESDYDYIELDDEHEHKIREALLRNVPKPEPTTADTNDYSAENDTLWGEGEIEINHETGEITFIHYDELVPILSQQDGTKKEENILSTTESVSNVSQQSTGQTEQTTRGLAATVSPKSRIVTKSKASLDDEKLKKKIEKQKKKFRGIVAQLLHQVGRLVETGAESEQDSDVQTNININIGTGVDLSSAGSLYSRILSQNSSNLPRLRINVDLQL